MDFSFSAIDAAIRLCINSMTSERENFYETLKELLSLCSVNHLSKEDKNSTILMLACELNEYKIIETIMNKDFLKDETDVKKEPVNMNLHDALGRNCLHYLLSLDANQMTIYRQRSEFNSELNILHILEYLSGHLGEDKKKISKQKKNANGYKNFNLAASELYKVDNYGHNSISLSLTKGYYKVSKYLINKGVLKGLYHTDTNSNSKDNTALTGTSGFNRFLVTGNGYSVLHCAIYGRNINCLYLMLSYCHPADLFQRNKDGLTPSEFAKSLHLHYFYKVLKFYETNINNTYSKKYFCSCESFVDTTQLLNYFYSGDKYDECLFILEKLKLTNSLGDSSSYSTSLTINKDNLQDTGMTWFIYNEMSINWNIMLCHYMMLKKHVTAVTANSKQDLMIKPENVISKFANSNNHSNNHSSYNTNYFSFLGKEDSLFIKMNNFFTNTSVLMTEEHFEENSNLLVLLFNKILFYYKSSNYSGCIKSSYDLLYFLKIRNKEIDQSLYLVLYINSSLILLDVLLTHNLVFLASIILERVEIGLNMTHKERSNFPTDENISKYLIKNEYLHNNRKHNWDEIFCVINLFKAHRDLHHSFNELKKNDSVSYIKIADQLENNCSYKNELPIFNTIKMFSECIKARLCYLEDSQNTNQMSKILNDIYNKCVKESYLLTNKEENAKKINREISFPDSPSTLFTYKELYLFYCNSQAILFLKQKKFHLSEIQLKTAISYYNKISFLDSSKKEFTFAVKLGYIHALKYNLAIVYFFQKRFALARNLLSLLSKTNNTQVNTNVFLWYRLGLSCLELVNYDFIDAEEDTDSEHSKRDRNKSNNNKDNDKDKEDVKRKATDINSIFNSNYYEKNSNILYSSIRPKSKILNPQNKNTSEEAKASHFNNFLHSHQVILITKLPPNEQQVSLLSESILAFKQILIIINQDLKGNHLLCGKALYELFTIFSMKEYYKDDNEYISLVNSNYKSKSYCTIVISTYLNLLFALICLERWNEVLFYIEEFEKSDYYGIGSTNSNTETKAKVNSFKLLSYIHLKQYDRAKELSESLFNSNLPGKFAFKNDNIDYKLTFKYSKFFTQPDTSFNISMLVNVAKMHYSNNKIEDGDKVLNAIIETLVKEKVPESEFPFFVVNMIIFTLLYKGLTELVLKIIKYRKIYEVLAEVRLFKPKN